MDGYTKDTESCCLSDTMAELRRGNKVYIYNPNILEAVKKEFNNLEIIKKDFYWTVKNNGEILTRRGRPKKKNNLGVMLS